VLSEKVVDSKAASSCSNERADLRRIRPNWSGCTFLIRVGVGHFVGNAVSRIAAAGRDRPRPFESRAGLGSIDQVRLSGGGAKSSLWRQILADVFATELVTVNTTEGAAYGAALLAGVGAGIWPNVDTACSQTIRVTDRVTPNPATTDTYYALHQQYQNLYPALKPTFQSLSSAM